ncbi:MAG: cyclic lactone autoinducer peptide [Saccharofermentans sp.]|nr:cyclic lactone autoinducer peptide [Saccharofermentans sp.]
MTKNEFEKKVLTQVEKMSRNNVDPFNGYPWKFPNCSFILHQPKRPRR